jgi:hypothetical protein
MTDETKKEISYLDDAKQTLAALNEAKATAKTEADRLEKLKADNLLSGTAGIRPPEVKPQELTPKEYKNYIEKHGKPPQ